MRNSSPPNAGFRRHVRTAIALTASLASSLALSGPFEDAIAAKNGGDYSRAFPILQRLAFQGNEEAQFQLSLMYLQGQGVKPSAKDAYRWLSQSARRGNPEAQSNLGVLYARGRYIPQDTVKAYVWFSLAVRMGNRDASTNLDAVRRKMNSEQIAAGNAALLICDAKGLNQCE
jgi:TPR repeat protein